MGGAGPRCDYSLIAGHIKYDVIHRQMPVNHNQSCCSVRRRSLGWAVCSTEPYLQSTVCCVLDLPLLVIA